MELNHLIQLISDLTPNHKCKYVRGEEYCTFLEIEPEEPRVKSLTPTGDEHSVSGSYLEKLADNIKEFEPFNISQLMNNSGSNRPVIESIIAHTSEFYWIQRDRARYVVWIPNKPHNVGELIQWTDFESLQEAARHFYMTNYLANANSSIQAIYYGCPGTGKSHTIKMIAEGKNGEKVIKYEDGTTNVFRTTFHPDYDYATFVGGYKPLKNDNNELDYQFIPQVFTNAYVQALKHTDNPIFLIIEEINRGNCAQIFGDLFQLLDRNDYGFSDYYIHADRDMQKHLAKAFNGIAMNDSHKNSINAMYHNGEKDIVAQVLTGEILLLPNNLYIWATMNTSDQSLFPIDSAFKRRWDWEYEPIKYKNTDWIINIQNNSYSWESFQREINKRVFAANNSEDKMLGDYFVNPADGIITEKMLLNKILFYLWNDVCKDGEGDIFKTSATDEISFSELHGNGGTDKLIAMMAYWGITELDYREDNADTVAGTDTKKKLPKYSINGSQELYSTPKAVQYIIGDFAQSHQDMPVDEMISLWNEISERKNCLVESWTPSPNDNQTFATKRRTEIKWGDKSAWVINGWTEELFNTFIKNVREKIGIEIKKAE